MHLLALLAAACFLILPESGKSQTPIPASEKPYTEEWVYKIKYGFRDEWWKIFQQYQVVTLDKAQSLGYITEYSVYTPGLHTSEDSRWDFRVIIVYKNIVASTHLSEVEKQLFGSSPTFKKDENRRWELTANHWDLPIHSVDPHQPN